MVGDCIWVSASFSSFVHRVVVPNDAAGLGRAIVTAHRRYTHFNNARGRWTGHLFQSLFAWVVMDEGHLLAAIRYVSLIPVRAGLVARAQDRAWSSACAHFKGEDDGLVSVEPVLSRIPDFAAPLAQPGDGEFNALRACECTGRPLACAAT